MCVFFFWRSASQLYRYSIVRINISSQNYDETTREESFYDRAKEQEASHLRE